MFANDMSNLIYKVCKTSEWDDAVQSGIYGGSCDDRRDGFIHFSTADQLAGTLAKHFAGQDDLVLLTFDSNDLDDRLKWEKSRGGELFPHFYGTLKVTEAKSLQNLSLGPDGHVLPDLETS